MTNETTFYCPLYEGDVTQYDCDEICVALTTGRLWNDGLPPVLPLEEIQRRKDRCLNCDRCDFAFSEDGAILRLFYTPPRLMKKRIGSRLKKSKNPLGKPLPMALTRWYLFVSLVFT